MESEAKSCRSVAVMEVNKSAVSWVNRLISLLFFRLTANSLRYLSKFTVCFSRFLCLRKRLAASSISPKNSFFPSRFLLSAFKRPRSNELVLSYFKGSILSQAKACSLSFSPIFHVSVHIGQNNIRHNAFQLCGSAVYPVKFLQSQFNGPERFDGGIRLRKQFVQINYALHGAFSES